jgi:hypothetical protein
VDLGCHGVSCALYVTLLYCNLLYRQFTPAVVEGTGDQGISWIEPHPVFMEKTAFVTVGSTQFDALVDAVLGCEVIQVLREHKYTCLVVQAGKSPIHVENAYASISDDGIEVWRVNIRGLGVEVWRFKPSLELSFRSADLVVCHAGESLPGNGYALLVTDTIS